MQRLSLDQLQGKLRSAFENQEDVGVVFDSGELSFDVLLEIASNVRDCVTLSYLAQTNVQLRDIMHSELFWKALNLKLGYSAGSDAGLSEMEVYYAKCLQAQRNREQRQLELNAFYAGAVSTLRFEEAMTALRAGADPNTLVKLKVKGDTGMVLDLYEWASMLAQFKFPSLRNRMSLFDGTDRVAFALLAAQKGGRMTRLERMADFAAYAVVSMDLEMLRIASMIVVNSNPAKGLEIVTQEVAPEVFVEFRTSKLLRALVGLVPISARIFYYCRQIQLRATPMQVDMLTKIYTSEGDEIRRNAMLLRVRVAFANGDAVVGEIKRAQSGGKKTAVTLGSDAADAERVEGEDAILKRAYQLYAEAPAEKRAELRAAQIAEAAKARGLNTRASVPVMTLVVYDYIDRADARQQSRMEAEAAVHEWIRLKPVANRELTDLMQSILDESTMSEIQLEKKRVEEQEARMELVTRMFGGVTMEASKQEEIEELRSRNDAAFDLMLTLRPGSDEYAAAERIYKQTQDFLDDYVWATKL